MSIRDSGNAADDARFRRERQILEQAFFRCDASNAFGHADPQVHDGIDFKFKCGATGDDFSFWLVFPADADFEKNKISVVSPIGCALLGSKIGDLVIIETPAGQKKVKIKKILRQSETVGK